MEFKVGTLLDKVCRVRAVGGRSAVNQKTYGVAASQTIKRGDFLKLTSGTALLATVEQAIALSSTPYECSGSGGNLGIMGMALADITTGSDGLEAITGRSTIPVAVTDGNEFLMRTLDTAHDVDADGSYSEVQDTAVGTSYALGRATGATVATWQYVVTITTSNGEFREVEKYPGQALGDDYGIAWYRIVLSDTVRQV